MLVVNRRRSVNSIQLRMHTTCTHVVKRSAVLADTDICLIVKRQPVSVRKDNATPLIQARRLKINLLRLR